MGTRRQGDIAPRGSTPGPLGAFGLLLDGFDEGRDWLSTEGAFAERWVTRLAPMPPAPGPVRLSDGRLAGSMPDGSWIDIDRTTHLARFAHVDAARYLASVHPWATLIGSCAARWRGDAAFHAAAVSVDGVGAWLLLGGHGAGKSTSAALLSLAGAAVVSDDLSVIVDGMVQPGPRGVDLRPPAAALIRTTGSDDLVEVLPGRHRLPVGPTAPVPLIGFVRLDWGGLCSVSDTPTRQRLADLLIAQGAPHTSTVAEYAASFAAMPMITWTRRQDVATAAADLDVLLAALS